VDKENKDMIRQQSEKVRPQRSLTPLWDAFYIRSQNRKFKNKWDKVKKANG